MKEPDFSSSEFVKKLILLFIMEKMEFPLTDESLNDIAATHPDWLTYMDLRDALSQLVETNLAFSSVGEGANTAFNITQDGRTALAHFYMKIPQSIRTAIANFANENRQKFKRRQEYTWDYFKATDGGYIVVLKIVGSIEIKLHTDTRARAKAITTNWREMAPNVYELFFNLGGEE